MNEQNDDTNKLNNQNDLNDQYNEEYDPVKGTSRTCKLKWRPNDEINGQGQNYDLNDDLNDRNIEEYDPGKGTSRTREQSGQELSVERERIDKTWGKSDHQVWMHGPNPGQAGFIVT